MCVGGSRRWVPLSSQSYFKLFFSGRAYVSREVSTEFDGRRISLIVHRSASDKRAVGSFTLLACLGPSLIPRVKERERVSGKVSNQRFVNSCLAN